VRLSRLSILPAFLALPLVLGACGGGSSAAAGVTPTATASIQIIGTPAPSIASSTAFTSTSDSASALTISATGSASTVSSAVTTALTGAAYTVSGTGGIPLVLRQSPNGAKIKDVPAGGVVTALGDPTQQAGAYTWIHVKTANGDVGWVATQFLAGGPAATPLPGGQQ